LPAPLAAQQWQVVSRNPDNGTVAIDPKSVHRMLDTAAIWERQTQADSTVVLVAVFSRCSVPLWRLGPARIYDKSGKLVESNDDFTGDWRPIQPSSVNDAVRQIACAD
jgi:hypothetical protein